MQRRRDERARSAGVAECAQVLDVAHAAAREQLEVGKGRVELGDQPDVRAGAAAHSRQVEHDRLAQSCAVQARHRVERRQPRELRVGRQRAAVAQVRAQNHGSRGKFREQPVERIGAGQRLGPDHDAVRADVQQRPRPCRLADARVDHDARLARERSDGGAVLAFAGCAADRVEVGDVQLVEPQLAERPCEGKRVTDRAIAFALAADGVNCRAGFEIDDSNDAHASVTTLAVDIGGANTKAAWLDGASLRTLSRPFEVWRDRDALSTVLREVAAGPAAAVAITMTAELSDAFRTKREGVAFVLDAAQAAFGDRPLSVLTTAGELVTVEQARARPWDVAAANWVATALAVAAAYSDALLIDVGSTTADIIPIAAGRVAATGHNDLERLLAGELVYTGVLRTNLAAIAPRVPVRGEWCPVSSEYFAISADIHLVLGQLEPEAYDCPTPDDRPATVAFARERIARLVCSDLEQLGEGDVDVIAAFLHGKQLRQIEDAARRAQLPPDAPVVAVGSGAFLGREVAARIERTVADAPWGATGGEVAPAAALAALLAARC
jgi:(4-(4-[2-(gamma-L-glutamylamino)ethyl]phenoxymethyl)furan-2-yl)methanamine synthase